MKTYKIPHTDLVVSRIAYGCGMFGWDKLDRFPKLSPLAASEGFNFLSVNNAVRVTNTAYDNGINFFDLADIYGMGNAEAAFGEVLKQSSGLRDKIVIQSKCGLRYPNEPNPGNPSRVDLSREHIVRSAEGSLRRLGTDHLDIFMLHFPDPLVEPEEVARAFDELHRSGKVRHFGVSNHTASQIARLKKHVRQPLVANQIHLGLMHCHLIADGMEFALEAGEHMKLLLDFATTGKPIKFDRYHIYTAIGDVGTLDYCCLHEIQIQAYSPLRGDLLNAPTNATPQVKQAAQILAELAREKHTAPSAIALAWLLRHPAGVVPVIGAGTPEHVIENCAADRVSLSREEWYTIFACVAAAEAQSRKVFSVLGH